MDEKQESRGLPTSLSRSRDCSTRRRLSLRVLLPHESDTLADALRLPHPEAGRVEFAELEPAAWPSLRCCSAPTHVATDLWANGNP